MRRLVFMALNMIFSVHLAFAEPALIRGLPSLSSLKLGSTDLILPETHEGVVMEVRGEGAFIMREKVYQIFRESEVNGSPAEQSGLSLRKGQKVKAVVYRLPNKVYFVSELQTK